MPPRVVRTEALAPLSERTGISPRSASRADHHGVINLDAHALEALVEIDAVRGGVEDSTGLDAAGRIVLDHGRSAGYARPCR